MIDRRHRGWTELTRWADSPCAVLIEDDPRNLDRVEITFRGGQHVNMTVASFHGTCRVCPLAEFHSLRVRWDG